MPFNEDLSRYLNFAAYNVKLDAEAGQQIPLVGGPMRACTRDDFAKADKTDVYDTDLKKNNGVGTFLCVDKLD